MWLHVIAGDKFADSLVDMFEAAAPGRHVYCIAPQDPGEVLRLIRSRDDWEGVIFNPLDLSWLPLLPSIPPDVRVIWYRWGFETYNFLDPFAGAVHGPKTKAWVERDLSALGKLHARASRYLTTRRARRLLRRVDVYVSQHVDEYNLLRATGILSASTEFRFGVVGLWPQTDIVSGLGRDILLNNSASATGNHMEAIDWLARCDLTGRKVVVPLSYGNDEYRDMILDYGASALGDHFEPVTEFLPLDEYGALLDRCGFAVMNHLRQQAVGNITMSMMKGARVFLNDTPIYRGYRNWGCHVARLNLDRGGYVFRPLSEREKRNNHATLSSQLGTARVILELRKML